MTDIAVTPLEERQLSGLDFNLRARKNSNAVIAQRLRRNVENANWMVVGAGSVLCLIAGMTCGVWLQF